MAEIQATCPRCGGQSFYVNTDKRVYYCHHAKCGIRGTTGWLKSHYGLDVSALEPSPFIVKPKPRLQRKEGAPSAWELGQFSRNYLEKRHVPAWLYETLPIYETAKGLLFEFPGFNFWQERRWLQHRPPPWFNKPGPGASEGIYYHVRTSPKDERVFLVEGIFDALVVGTFANAVATLSWRIHMAQLDSVEKQYKKIIYVPDSDVLNEDVMAQLAQLPKGSELVRLPGGHDPASLHPDVLEDYCNL